MKIAPPGKTFEKEVEQLHGSRGQTLKKLLQ